MFSWQEQYLTRSLRSLARLQSMAVLDEISGVQDKISGVQVCRPILQKSQVHVQVCRLSPK